MSIKTRYFIPFCIVMVLIGSGLALLANTHAFRAAYAAPDLPESDLSVVGPPTLPASTVDSIFTRLGSPMVGTGALVEQTARQVNIDDAFALAVFWTETNDGAAGVGRADHNPGSVRGSVGYPSAYDGYTIYPNFADAIVYWFHLLKNRYVGGGLTTVYAISHPYVGTSTSYLWAGKVVALMLRYRGEAPPPTPSPTVSPDMLAHKRNTIQVNAIDTSTSAQASASPVAGPQAVTHGAPATQQASQPGSALSTTATLPIVLCALLLALAIALGTRLLLAPLPASKRHAMEAASGAEGADAMNRVPTSASFKAPTTDALYPLPAFQSRIFRLPSRPLDEPRTGALVGTRFTASESTASEPRTPEPTTSKLRRVQLRPAPATTEQLQESPAATGGHPTGLLARYGNTPNP